MTASSICAPVQVPVPRSAGEEKPLPVERPMLTNDYIKDLVDQAPPLAQATKDRLAVILRASAA